MGMRILLSLFVLVVLADFHVKAQSEKGSLLIAIDPDDAIIRLDTALFKQQKSHIAIDTGLHVIRAWAPGKILVTDTINITTMRPVLYRKKLENSPEYKDYLRKKHVRNVALINLRYVPIAITAAATIYFIGARKNYINDADKNKKEAEESKAIYDNSMDAQTISYYHQVYDIQKERYNSSVKKANNITDVAKIAIPAGIVVTGVLYYFSTKITKPVFTETPALSNLSFNYEIFGQNAGPRFQYSLKF